MWSLKCFLVYQPYVLIRLCIMKSDKKCKKVTSLCKIKLQDRGVFNLIGILPVGLICNNLNNKNCA